MSQTVDRLNAALEDRYRIERELGHGGMATVYLADDLRHDRRVAIKVLKPELAAVIGAERFLAEIRTTANLQHPNILPLFDSGEADGFLFYVMPYVEGESLHARLDRERQLPVEEAVRLAAEIAEALHAAHEVGVIHRDIKPANVLLSRGRPLVADFGISLAVSASGGGRLTETGLSLGTPFYMSPEQASADRDPTAASDVYSLGCVLYEMLVGEPPFTGPSAQAVLGKVLAGDAPRPADARASIPPNVDAAIRRALERLPADRFVSVDRFAAALRDQGFRHGVEPTTVTAAGAGVWKPLAVVATASTIALGAALLFRPSAPEPSARHLSIPLPASAPLTFAGPSPLGIWQKALDISRDGSTVVYVAMVDGRTQLHVRRMEDQAIAPLPGTEGAYHPFFSPEGDWIGFFVGQELRKIRTTGGQPLALRTQIVAPVGASWSEDGRIFLANHEGREPMWIPEGGGAADSVGTVNRQFNAPHLLPGGGHALVTVHFTGQLGLYTAADNTVAAITRRGLVSDSMPLSDWLVGYSPTYSRSGHILYLSPGDGVMMALPFDAERLEVLGDPRPILDDVRKEETYGFGHVAVSDDGTLVYASGSNADIGYLGLRGADGAVDTLPFGRAAYEGVRMSPDGSKILATRRNEVGVRSAFLHDLGTGRAEPLPAPTANPNTWFAGGDSLILGDFLQGRWWSDDNRDAQKVVYSLLTGDSRPFDLPRSGWMDASSPSGGMAWNTFPAFDVLVRMPGDTTSVLVAADGGQVDLSPDGRWVAFFRASEQAVLVSSVPPGGPFHRVSQGAGEQPQWSAEGDRIVYRDGRTLWEVDIDTEGAFRAGEPRVLAEGPFVRVWNWSYDLAPDGRPLVVLGPPEESVGRIAVITDFFEMLRGGA